MAGGKAHGNKQIIYLVAFGQEDAIGDLIGLDRDFDITFIPYPARSRGKTFEIMGIDVIRSHADGIGFDAIHLHVPLGHYELDRPCGEIREHRAGAASYPNPQARPWRVPIG